MIFLFKNKLNGIKVPHHKKTMKSKMEIMPIPQKVYISMSQHMGPPCEAIVKIGDLVKVGTKIGDSTAFLSSPIHSSVSGKVVAINDIDTAMGGESKVVVIESDGLQAHDESIKKPVVNNLADFVAAVRSSGSVGLGGAGFPTSVKLTPKNLDEVDTLIVNAAECEPYITSDYQTMMNHSDNVYDGVMQIKKHMNLKNVYLGIEDNKPKAIKLFEELFKNEDDVKVVTLPSSYPQGAEKVIVHQTTGRVVPMGKLPSDVGVVVFNVTTCAFISSYLKTGMPLTFRCVTVDGNAVNTPKNVKALIGTPYSELFEFCGGLKSSVAKVIMGGPMMGITVHDINSTVLKNNNAILAFTTYHEETASRKSSPCIRCGRCVSACPLSLLPTSLEHATIQKDTDELTRLCINNCMECGSCAYVCPAKRCLVTSHKIGKALLRNKKG